MKGIIIILILALVGFFAYTYFFPSLSEEEQAVKDLTDRFNQSSRQFVGAGRLSGATGLSTVSDTEAAVERIKKIKQELTKLSRGLTEENAQERAKKLKIRIDEFYQKNEL